MNKLFNIVVDILEEKNHIITEDTDLITDLGYDSLKFIQLIAEIEEVFQLEFVIDEIEIEKLRHIKMLKQLIEKKVGENE